MREVKYYQLYVIVLTNGKEIETMVDYSLAPEKNLIAEYARASDNTVMGFSIGSTGNFAYIPKKNILYIYERILRKEELGEYNNPNDDNPCA